MKSLSWLKFAPLAGLLLAIGEMSGQQKLRTPRPGPGTRVSQAIGIGEVSVFYHRPAVQGRTIWGRLVPYGEVRRAGANENTIISFSHPVTIEGRISLLGPTGST